MTQQNLYTLNPDAVNARTFIDKLQLAGVQLSLSCGKAKAGLRTLQGFECLVVWQDLYRKPKQPSHIASNKSSVLWGYNTLWVIVGIKHPPPSPPPPPGCWFCCFFVMVLLICWPIPFTLVLLIVTACLPVSYRFLTGFTGFLPVFDSLQGFQVLGLRIVFLCGLIRFCKICWYLSCCGSGSTFSCRVSSVNPHNIAM